MSKDEKLPASPAPAGSASSTTPGPQKDRPLPVSSPQRRASDRLAYTKKSVSIAHLGANVLPGTRPVDQRIIEAQYHRQTFNGPMPHPDILEGYGKLVDTAPERILKVFEADSQHVRDFETAALAAQRGDNKRLHWMAYSLIATGYGMSALFALMDKDWLAGIVLTTTIVGTVVGFLQGKKDTRSHGAAEDDA